MEIHDFKREVAIKVEREASETSTIAISLREGNKKNPLSNSALGTNKQSRRVGAGSLVEKNLGFCNV